MWPFKIDKDKKEIRQIEKSIEFLSKILNNDYYHHFLTNKEYKEYKNKYNELFFKYIKLNNKRNNLVINKTRHEIIKYEYNIKKLDKRFIDKEELKEKLKNIYYIKETTLVTFWDSILKLLEE